MHDYLPLSQDEDYEQRSRVRLAHRGQWKVKYPVVNLVYACRLQNLRSLVFEEQEVDVFQDDRSQSIVHDHEPELSWQSRQDVILLDPTLSTLICLLHPSLPLQSETLPESKEKEEKDNVPQTDRSYIPES